MNQYANCRKIHPKKKCWHIALSSSWWALSESQKKLHGIFLNSRSCALCSVKLNISRFLIVTKISPIQYILSQIVIIKVINKIQRGRKCTGALSPAKMTFEIAVLYKDDKFYIISKFFHVQIKQYHRQFTKHNIFFWNP